MSRERWDPEVSRILRGWSARPARAGTPRRGKAVSSRRSVLVELAEIERFELGRLLLYACYISVLRDDHWKNRTDRSRHDARAERSLRDWTRRAEHLLTVATGHDAEIQILKRCLDPCGEGPTLGTLARAACGLTPSPWGSIYYAIHCIRERRFERAIDELHSASRATQSHLSLSIIWDWMGHALTRLDRLQDALDAYRRACVLSTKRIYGVATWLLAALRVANEPQALEASALIDRLLPAGSPHLDAWSKNMIADVAPLSLPLRTSELIDRLELRGAVGTQQVLRACRTASGGASVSSPQPGDMGPPTTTGRTRLVGAGR